MLAGKLRFLDVVLKPKVDNIALHESPGIAIDRRTTKVREGALFILEGILGKKAKLRVIADNLIPSAEDSKLFASTLEAVSGFSLIIGAWKSTETRLLTLNSKSSHWYIINLRDDRNGVKIGNPFKHAEKKSMEEFLKWLRG